MAATHQSKRPVVFFFVCLAAVVSADGGYEASSAARTLKQEDKVHEIHCSRERSRAAWKIIEEYLMPFVEKERYHISTRCKLHPDNDLYRDQERHKIHEDVNEWRCGYCKKSFYEEKHLDKHFDNRHYNFLNATLANICFLVNEGPSAHWLNEFFLRQFCDAYTCSGSQNHFLKGAGRSILYIVTSILILILLLLFYVFLYLYKRGMKPKRISKVALNKKPS